MLLLLLLVFAFSLCSAAVAGSCYYTALTQILIFLFQFIVCEILLKLCCRISEEIKEKKLSVDFDTVVGLVVG